MTDGFPPKVAGAIRERKDIALRSGSPYAERQAETLEALATHIETVGIGDFQVQSLWRVSGTLGDSDNFNQGEWQQSYLANLAHSPDKPPEPEDALAGFVAAGIEDLNKVQSARNTELSRARSRADDLERELAQVKERAAELEIEKAAAVAEGDAARAEVANLKQQLDHLRLQARPSPAKPRKKPAGKNGANPARAKR